MLLVYLEFQGSLRLLDTVVRRRDKQRVQVKLEGLEGAPQNAALHCKQRGARHFREASKEEFRSAKPVDGVYKALRGVV